ncbi:MAG: hypothetical protein USCGTAYLOR_01713 [Chromatiales bacterium USCg_Taylor]|nr:MAG: hypothetical protein USCGTAYLOR_01713 [Chromatiales bacterium USCg_Taylor]
MLLAAACALIGLFPGEALAAGEGPNICGKTAGQLLKACRLEARDDYRVGTAICLNLSDSQAAETCKIATQEVRSEALAECRDFREARDEVCEGVGQGPYDPVIDPANFVSKITNRYAPFRPGAWWEYEKQTEEGLERIRVEVLKKRREILGVGVTTIRDRGWVDGVLIEDTIDWLAQDKAGNVWYFGEISTNFEDGLLASLDGSWEAGKDGAKPGFWVKRVPQVGEFYRQEYALDNEAEDIVEVLDLDAQEIVPFANGRRVLKTRDFTPLSPEAEENKFYVPGIGFVSEVDLETGETLELVDCSLC